MKKLEKLNNEKFNQMEKNKIPSNNVIKGGYKTGTYNPNTMKSTDTNDWSSRRDVFAGSRVDFSWL